jgi:hypothetical protein
VAEVLRAAPSRCERQERDWPMDPELEGSPEHSIPLGGVDPAGLRGLAIHSARKGRDFGREVRETVAVIFPWHR